MSKRWSFLSVVLLVLFCGLWGVRCDQEVDPGKPGPGKVIVEYKQKRVAVDLTKMSTTEKDGQALVLLKDVVTQAFPDADLSALRVDFIAEDCYRPSGKDCEPLSADKLSQGYIDPDTRALWWEKSLGLDGCYRVKAVMEIQLLAAGESPHPIEACKNKEQKPKEKKPAEKAPESSPEKPPVESNEKSQPDGGPQELLPEVVPEPVPEKNEGTLDVVLSGKTVSVALGSLPHVTFEGQPHIVLQEVVKASNITTHPENYKYDLEASDGFRPSKRGMAPLEWDKLAKGYFNPATRRFVWDASLKLPKTYSVKDGKAIHLVAP